MKKNTMIGVLATVGAVAAGLTGAAVYFYNMAYRRNPPKGINKVLKLEADPNKEKTKAEKRFDECVSLQKKWLRTVKSETVSVYSDDGLILYGTFIENVNHENKTAILVHGFHGDEHSFVGYDEFLYHLGYSLLFVDNRAHGRSSGNWIGMGHEDRRDLVKWCKKVIAMQGSNVKIILHGVSMGGAAVMEAAGEWDLPENVKAVIEDCGFSTQEAQFSHAFPESISFVKSPVIKIASLISKVNRGYYFSEAKPVDAVKRAKVPMLFIHGEKDDFVPTEMVYQVYRACKTSKGLLIVPKGEHFNSYWTNETMYQNAVATFLSRNV